MTLFSRVLWYAVAPMGALWAGFSIANAWQIPPSRASVPILVGTLVGAIITGAFHSMVLPQR